MNRIKSKETVNKISIRKPPKRIDGRSATRTGRIVQFATSVTPEFDNEIRKLARESNCMIVEVLERSLNLYKQERERERAKSGKPRKK